MSFQGLAEDSSICVWSRSCVQDPTSTQLACSLNLLEVGFPFLSPVGGPFSGLGFTTSLLIKQPLRFVVIRSLNRVRLFVTPWTAARPGFPVLPYLLEFARWCYPTISFSATPVSIFLFVFFTAVTGIQNFNSVSEIRPLLPDIQRGDLSYRFYFPVCTFFYGVPIVSLWIRTFLTWGLEMTKTALLFLVSLSSPPTSVNLWDCWPRTSNSRWW